MEKYIGSERHKENTRLAGEKGREKIKENKEERIKQYYENPNKCLHCNKPINYKKKNYKFCDSSCAAKFNNSKRNPPSEESKNKTSLKLKAYTKEYQEKYTKEKQLRKCKVCGEEFIFFGYLKTTKYICSKWRCRQRNKLYKQKCKICGKEFEVKTKRKTCSDECRVKLTFLNRKYQNGRKKVFLYNNKIQGEVLLESSWELKIAELLDLKNINWIRPEPLNWTDDNLKKHLYYPDFYLIDYDIHLDPKNPYCMKLDEEKMNKIEKQINIIYGHINIIIDYIKNLN